ncbi:synaptotagmin-like protein 4 isoform X1 [Pecten maximus]|uniref:synaptotagmin-like protein 4 isoform X1 n=1 Tax=Pecten maximus TaxID=6579 RepID=UPI0014591856|nr:synaptotagmin-like protein 4 isoform X1 [Pecten maximus]
MEKMTMENLIDVDGLSEEERAVILNVLKRDESLRKTESLKVRQLRLEIQSIRMKSVLRDGDDLSKMCARCHSELGFLFNRGEICPTCHFKVCKLCQETLLNGKWLCSLCYKQRQLKWLQQDGVQNSSGLKRWPSGADLVKASIRKTLVIADPGAESDPGAETGYKLNGATVRNGSIHKDKSPQDAERIEYPKDSDKRKLTQLFDAFKMQKKTDSPERRLQQQTSVRRATSRRYGTDTESSSSSDEDVSSSLPASMLTTVSVQSSPASSRVSGYNTTASEFEEIHVSDSVLHKTSESVNSSPRKSLQRKHSYDSDQTIHSDDAPFSKSSTETQIRVEVHSDASSTQSADIVRPKTSPSKSASSNSQNSYSKVRQSSKEGYVKVTRKESSSSQRSTSPEMGGMRHVQVSRQSVLQPGRSPSPYSFDSIPSSHANSPLPRQRILDQTLDYPLQKNSSEDTDSLSRFSGTEYSGTESSYHIRDGSSGGDDLMMDDISKVKFHKLSKKIEKSRSRSPHSPNTKKDIPPKLSPRASSEGSGSLEDSGHVSGTSTQDNTPEHRRTDSIQSQMSVPSTLSTVTDVSNKEDDSEADIDELVASHKASTQSSYGSSRGNLLSTVADSRESIASFYSDAGGVNYGKVPITGEIQFGLDYNYRTGSLEIAIRQCKDLAPADPKRHRSDPYVKTYLLPDKTRGGKRKTRVKKNTICPIFDETLRYLISKSEVENRILWVTVWHNDRFGRNDFLGEVSINFDYFRFGDSAPKWYTLQERVETQTTSLLTYQGDLILSLRLVSRDNVKELLTSPTKTKRKKAQPDGQSGFQLQVLVKEARNLTAVRSNGFSDPFCKAYLLPDKSKGLKQKTPVIKRDCNPKWNYKFIFDDVSPDDLKERGLELTIWDYDKISSNDFLGGVRLSLGLGRSYGKIVDWNDAKGEEISIWQAMLDRPDSWIDGTLILRPNMDKRRY